MPKTWWSTGETDCAAEGKKALLVLKLFTSDWSVLGADKFLVLFLTDKKNVDNPFRWKNLYLSVFIFNCTLCACSFPENNANYQLLGIWAFVWHFSKKKNTCKHLTLRRMLNRFMYQGASFLSQLCWLKIDWLVNLGGKKVPVHTHPSRPSSPLVVM